MRSVRVVGLLLSLSWLCACARDLSIPEAPLTGGLQGTIDTAGHINPEGRDLILVDAQSGEPTSVTTVSGGVFIKTGLRPGPYSLQFVLPGFGPFTQLVKIEPGATADLGTLRPIWLVDSASEATVSGRVVGSNLSVDGGVVDAGVGAVSDVQGARVEFVLTAAGAEPVAVAVVDALGSFTARVPPGDYTLKAHHPFFLSAERAVTVQAAERLDLSQAPLVLPLNPATIEGEVLREVDGQSAPVAAEGALVVSDTGRTAVVDASGHFTLTDLAGGARRLTLALAGHHDELSSRVVQIGGGETITLPSITLRLDRGSLTGEVELLDGLPATQVVVDVPNTTYATVVVPSAPGASRGRFFLSGVPLRSVVVRAAKPNYISASSTPVTPVRDMVLDVGLLRLAPLSGAFEIDDGDAFNQPGFCRGPAVTLRFSNVGTATEVRAVEGSAANLATAAWTPLGTTGVPFTLSSGDGLKTVFAQLRTTAGDEGALLEARITLDQTAPDGAASTLVLQSPSLNAFTNTELVLARLTLGAGAETSTAVKVAAAATAGTCVASDFALALSMPVVNAYPVTLLAGDGLKGVCLQLFDSAGNPSDPISATITLDKTAPTTPVLLTSGDQFLPLANDTEFVVLTSGPVTEANFQAYEQLGGLQTVWTPTTSPQSTTTFRFRVENTGAEDGTRNILRLRAVDLAGNLSGEAVIFVTADTNAPDGIPPILDEYLDHGDGMATVYWRPSPSGALGYRLYYGPTDTDLTGTSAPEGPSPIDVGARRSFTLTDLVNDTVTHVRIAPYDRAGNEGPRVGGPFVSARLSPAVVSPNVVGSVPLQWVTDGGTGAAQALAMRPPYAYVSSVIGGRVVVAVVDLSALQSPIQGGAIDLDAGQATQVGLIDLGPGAVPSAGNQQLLADGPMLYVASGRYLRILGLENPRQPRLKAELDFGTINASLTLRDVHAVYGNKVVVTGTPSPAVQQFTAVIDVSSLFDDLESTRPTMSDVQHVFRSYPTGSTPVATVLLGSRLVTASGWWADDQLADALDSNAGTTWGPEDFRVFTWDGGQPPPLGRPLDTHRASGNLLVSSASVGLTVTSLGDTTTTRLGELPFNGLGIPVLAGSEAISWKSSGTGVFSVVDLSNVATPSLEGALSVSALGGLPAATWGSWALVLQGSRVMVLELATPRALTLRATAPGALGSGVQVEPGFAFTSSGKTYDLYGGVVPPAVEPDGPCQTSTAWFSGVSIGASGNQLVITDLSTITDRDAGTPATRTTVPLGAPSQRVSGVARWGNYLVAAEVRTDAGVNGDGLWMEVFDVSKALDLSPATSFTLADRKAEFRFAPLPVITGVIDPLPPRTQLEVTMNDGRAVVSYEVLNYGYTGPLVQFFDLRPLFDDDSATSFSPDAGFQGAITTPGITAAVTQAGWAYLLGPNGFAVASVAAAFDDDPATLVSGAPTLSTTLHRGSTGISVKGTRLYVSGGAVVAYDVRNPLAPQVTSTMNAGGGTVTCRPLGETFDRPTRSGVEPAGALLFNSNGTAFNVLNVE